MLNRPEFERSSRPRGDARLTSVPARSTVAVEWRRFVTLIQTIAPEQKC
jgi:hypothetical protein